MSSARDKAKKRNFVVTKFTLSIPINKEERTKNSTMQKRKAQCENICQWIWHVYCIHEYIKEMRVY